MKIGLDYGGVMDDDPEGWIITIQNLIGKGHQVYLISHCHPGEYDNQRRQYICDKSDAVNLSFDDTMDESIIRGERRNWYKNIKLSFLLMIIFTDVWKFKNLIHCVPVFQHIIPSGLLQKCYWME